MNKVRKKKKIANSINDLTIIVIILKMNLSSRVTGEVVATARDIFTPANVLDGGLMLYAKAIMLALSRWWVILPIVIEVACYLASVAMPWNAWYNQAFTVLWVVVWTKVMTAVFLFNIELEVFHLRQMTAKPA
jgi:hypothetical protein